MSLLPGVYLAAKKNGSTYYRASITCKNNHISLGSFDSEEKAHNAYLSAGILLNNPSIRIEDYDTQQEVLSFEKWVILINLRDNGIYFKTPIYIRNRFFLYYMDEGTQLKFAVDDLFYYSKHKIMKRGNHLFVADFGMQVNILSRYGIKNFAVPGRDYLFMNGDNTDFRYENISIINKYHGVLQTMRKGFPIYTAKIHINGDYIVGRYSTENQAAAAYNKAAELLMERGIKKVFPLNYINELNTEEYLALYKQVKISRKIRDYCV